jgi:hypothetical protein
MVVEPVPVPEEAILSAYPTQRFRFSEERGKLCRADYAVQKDRNKMGARKGFPSKKKQTQRCKL